VLRALLSWVLLSFALIGTAYALPNEVSYTIAAALDTEQNIIEGRETVELINRTGRELSELYFHVYPNAFKRGSNSQYQRELCELGRICDPDAIYADPDDDAFMEIESVTVYDARVGLSFPVKFTVEDTLLTVELLEPLPDGGSVRLDLEFIYDLMEAPSSSAFAARLAIRSAHRAGVYTIALWYPKLAVYDEQGWHLQPYSYIGEFYGDFADYDVQLTVPEGFTVGATGRLEFEAVGSGVKTLRYAAERVHDFAWVACARYRVSEVEWDGITVRTLTLSRGDLAERALRALRFFSERFGRYAYPTFTVAEVEVGGGMEYPQMIMIAFGSEFEVSHEVAHQWWYGAVGNNEYNEAWLDEGFATYSQELYFIEELRQPEALARSTWEFREPGEVVLQPASQYPSLSSYAQAVYTKGSGILWMLRGLVGEDRFAEILREYYARFRFQNAKTPDFIATVEEVSGWKLDWFFDQWLRTTKRLDFSVSEARSTPLEDGRYEHRITVRRAGEAVMPVEVAFTTADGGRQSFRWDGLSAERSFVYEGTAPLVRVEIDPEHKVLEENRENNVWAGWQAGLPGKLVLWIAVAALSLWFSRRPLVLIGKLKLRGLQGRG
jgi:hypothetical protein